MTDVIALRSKHETELRERDTRIAHLEEHMRWIRQTVHQAYHSGPIEECRQGICAAVHCALKGEPKE